MEEIENQTLFSKNRINIKGVLVGVLVLLLLIPTMFIRNLISERQQRKSGVAQEIGEKWGLPQTINGPILKIPYYKKAEVLVQDGGKQKKQISKTLSNLYLTTEGLNIDTKIIPQKRKRGIFEVVVYESELSISGSFKDIEEKIANLKAEDVQLYDATLLLGISDLRGLKNELKLSWNGKPNDFSESQYINTILGDAIIAKTPLAYKNLKNSTFKINLLIKGSETIDFVASGKNNTITAHSEWPNPSFSGSFLPDERKITKDGFTAKWNISHLSRNLPDSWKESTFPNFTEATFGVSLINPNDHYQKSERSVKYSILVIGLTFLAFFFVELLKKQKVHPFQYLLIGFALCIFYILLISFSEIMLFNWAYLFGSLMTLGLIFLYTKSIFTNNMTSSLVTGILTLLYIFIFVIIQLQDTALLIGSLGLFIILAITMFVSRRINWQTISE